ncbi:ABC transporter ATP-binding protein [Stackebrandtia soli]|uniref:ABC transporter ATP-binding protein n=1 Tax=Stackebrandtia soli TaxID=1892856 RepID=UPI0039EAC42D
MSDSTATPEQPRRPLRELAGVWRTVWRAGRWLAAAQLAITVITGLLPATTVWLMKLVIDALAADRAGTAIGAGCGLAAAGLLTMVLAHVNSYLRSELQRRIDRLMRDQLYTAVNAFQGLSRFEDPQFLDRLRMATQVNGPALDPVTSGMFDVGRNVITLATLIGTLFVISPIMTAVVIAAAVPALLAEISLARQRVGMYLGMSASMRRQFFYSSLITDVDAAKEVRLFGLGDFLKGRVLRGLGEVQSAERRLDRRELRTQSLLALLGAIVSGLGLVWAVYGAATKVLTLGDVSAFVVAIAGTQGALASLVTGIAGGHEALLMVGHHSAVRECADDLPPTTRPAALAPSLRQGIEVRDVWFRYADDHPWILRGVDFTIPHGQAVALVGLNGAGKSTLVKLLCRFYDPDRGSIRWDGVDIRDVDPAELRRRMGVLFQDFMSYDLTAMENVGIGDLDRVDDSSQVEKAARHAGIHDDVAGLPRGYDTMLSRSFFLEEEKDDPDTGVVLSGGQWQRLALARTFMRDSRDLLILDEPSAGLDARAEHEIHERLRAHRADHTSLLISHRLGTIRDANLIVVLADGVVAEQGDHDALMAADGPYSELFRMQASGYDAAATGQEP